MSFAQLISILAEVRQTAEDEKAAPLVDCPRCGILLKVRDGIYDCPLGHFTTWKATRAQ